MKLTDEEKSILSGEQGAGAKKAMEILVALGKIFNAQEMVPVTSAQIAGVSYRNIGDAGLEFLTDWANTGAQTHIPAFMNPAGLDRECWRQMGIAEEFALKQLAIIEQLAKMGVQPTLTCTPYHVGILPQLGEHIAWSESSAVSFANSVLGARTNREGGPSALAAAIVARTPRFGLHLPEKRLPNYHIIVKCQLLTIADYGALGYWIGKHVGDGIPYIDSIEFPVASWEKTACLKSLGAAMAASGAVALYYIPEVTPEADGLKPTSSMRELMIDSLQPAFAALKKKAGKLDIVTLGCPHTSLPELKAISQLLQGKRVKSKLWITSSAAIRTQAIAEGIVRIIEDSGGLVLADTCMVVAPLRELGFKHIAVDSAKAACYLPSHQSALTYWGTTEQCIDSAIEGKWKF